MGPLEPEAIVSDPSQTDNHDGPGAVQGGRAERSSAVVRTRLRAAAATGLRIAVTAGLLAVLLSRIELARLVDILANASLGSIALALVALAATIPFNAMRWHVIMDAVHASPGVARLLRISLTGLFFNQTLPTAIGGDAVRAWRCKLLGIRLATAVRGVLLDRASGFALVVVLYAAGLPFLLPAFSGGWQRLALVLILLIAVAGLVALFCLDVAPKPLLRARWIAQLVLLSPEARRLLRLPSHFARLLAWSAIGFALYLLSYQQLARSVGAELSWLDIALIVPPVTLVQIVPVSLAGWGVRETALVVVMAKFGVPLDVALATSLLFGFCNILIGLPGGLVWLTGWDIAGTTAPPRDEDLHR